MLLRAVIAALSLAACLQIANLTFARDVLAGTIRSALDDDSFGGGKIDSSQARTWIRQAQSLIDQAHALATS